MKVPFKHYLHDDEFDLSLKHVMAGAGYGHLYSEELREKVGRPFYEITLTCTLDTETGTITVEDVKL